MKISEDELRDLAGEAAEAFWQVVVNRFPAAGTGDLSPEQSIRMNIACTNALAEWIENNVPSV